MKIFKIGMLLVVGATLFSSASTFCTMSRTKKLVAAAAAVVASFVGYHEVNYRVASHDLRTHRQTLIPNRSVMQGKEIKLLDAQWHHQRFAPISKMQEIWAKLRDNGK